MTDLPVQSLVFESTARRTKHTRGKMEMVICVGLPAQALGRPERSMVKNMGRTISTHAEPKDESQVWMDVRKQTCPKDVFLVLTKAIRSCPKIAALGT